MSLNTKFAKHKAAKSKLRIRFLHDRGKENRRHTFTVNGEFQL